jgi:redox-sensitive bicupin YhaK (pirin superfamily)
MITFRRSAERHHVQRGKRDVWCTFNPKKSRDPLAGGFGTLNAFNELLIPPGASVPSLPFPDAEVITYVFEGALSCKSPTGRAGVTYAGEFHRRSTVLGHRHRETNSSRSAWTRIFQISLPSSPGGLPPGRESKRFTVAQRRGVLCVVASHDGRNGSLRIQARAQVVSAILDSGRHLAYELAPRSRAWLHVVAGEVQVGGVVLDTGDGAGIAAEHAVSCLARNDGEILLVALSEPQPRSFSEGFSP